MHSFFTLAVFALVNAYRDYKRKHEVKEEDILMGIRRWREERKSAVLDKGIVFVGDYYSIFWLAEIMVLSGVKVRDIPKACGTRKEIFNRYRRKPK